MGNQTRPASCPPRPQRTAHPSTRRPGIPQPPSTPSRMSGIRSHARQPRLDADNISLYRHHRCLQALTARHRKARQDFSGVSRTHQFLVTLTVHTNKINPRTSRQPHRQTQ
ncbi:hypothetical protein I553_9246 [Mycobacterium xenopi 4042]|uniref:Uncharacterized protein n=1 Tax=Mycobacterium xenopi 4042 TaxID=1299334 RepID=X8AA52_MYCXE|nr:hypothetical protein I553_9246 [Mycobacterium xenopi 4042]